MNASLKTAVCWKAKEPRMVAKKGDGRLSKDVQQDIQGLSILLLTQLLLAQSLHSQHLI